MSMTSQGFPLWAVEPDGAAYAVVGWDEYGFPSLVPVTRQAHGAESPVTGQAFTFTTTDPTGDAGLRAHMEALADELHGTECARLIRQRMDPTERPDDIRQRMVALAQDMYRSDLTSMQAANAILAELAK